MSDREQIAAVHVSPLNPTSTSPIPLAGTWMMAL